jgi:osmotically inducible lipoprotein OsmB
MKNKIIRYAAMVAVIISLTACSNMNDRQQKMVSGAAIGTGVGVVGAAATGGCVSCGAVIGAGVGTAAGAVMHR